MLDVSPSSTRSATPRRSTTRLVPVSADATRSSVAQPRHIQDKDGCNVRHDSESSSMYSTLLSGRLRAGCRMLCSVRVQPRRRSFLKERRCTDSDPVNRCQWQTDLSQLYTSVMLYVLQLVRPHQSRSLIATCNSDVGIRRCASYSCIHSDYSPVSARNSPG